MALSMRLPKDKNQLYFDFEDAYWAIDNVFFTTDTVDFSLFAYPNREAKLMNYSILPEPSIGYGSPIGAGSVNSALYQWHVTNDIHLIFPDGSIPAGRDAQYTAIYNWIKEYTELPFEDVLEENQEG